MSEGLIRAVSGRVRQMVARVVVSLVNDATKMQALQVQGYDGVVRDRAERFQNYGHTSVPLPGAEGIGLAVGGSTNHTVIIVMDDRRYRLTNLRPGESALYDDLGQCVHLTRDGIVIKGAGLPVLITDTPLITLDAAKTVMTGAVEFNGPSVKHNGKNIGGDHPHSGVQPGAGNSGPPVA